MADDRPDPTQLNAFPLFRGLSQAELVTLAGCVRRLDVLKAGHVLFDVGDPADGAWLIARGGLRLEMSAGDKTLTIARLGPGTVVGELCLIEDAPRSLRGYVTEPTDLLFVDAARFQALRAKREAAAYKVIRNICLTVCGRLRNTNTFIESELRGRRAMVVESHALAGTEDAPRKARSFLSRLFGGAP